MSGDIYDEERGWDIFEVVELAGYMASTGEDAQTRSTPETPTATSDELRARYNRLVSTRRADTEQPTDTSTFSASPPAPIN